MKQKLLNSIRLRAMMLVAVMCAAFAGQAWADTKSWDLSTASYSSSSESTVTWSSSDISMTLTKAKSSTAANNYLGGSGTYVHTRMYASQVLTWTPASGCTISSIAITTTGSSYNAGFTSGTWSNGSASASGTTVTVTPTDGSSAINCTIKSATRVTAITVTYSKASAHTITAVSNNNSYGTVSLSGTTITATPEDGYRVVAGDDGYTVTSGSANVTNNGDNTFSVTPTSDCTVQINFEAIPAHTLSSAVSPVEAGTVTLGSTSIFEDGTTTATAAANEGYKFTGWSISGTGASLSSTSTNPTTVTMGTANATITANFEAVVTHKVNWSVNDIITTDNVEEGAAITFPDDPADVNGKTFVGWYTAEYTHATDAPAFVNSANMGNADVTYYAVFATVDAGDPTVVTLSNSTITSNATGKGSYSNDYNIENWTGRYMINNNSSVYSLQLGYNTDSSKSAYNSHLTTPNCTDNIQSITIETQNSTASGRKFFLCSESDLGTANNEDATYGSGSLSEANGSVTINVTGNTKQLHIYPDGTAYIKTISLTSQSVSISDYTTDARAEAGISFANASVDAQLTSEYTGQVLTNPNSLTVSYSSSDATVATIDSGTGEITELLKAGSTNITASFAGNATYKPAEVSYTLNVTEKTPCGLAYDVVEVEKLTTDGTFTNALTNGYLLTVAYSSIDTDVATVNPSTGEVTINGAGSTTITAAFGGDATYEEGEASYTLTVIKATPTLSFASENATGREGEAFAGNELTNPANLSVSYSSSDTDVATVNETSGAVTIVAGGTTTITASFTGNDTYTAGSASYTLKVLATPMIPAMSDEEIAWGETFTVDDSGITGGPVSVSSDNTSIATVDGLEITPVACGEVEITVCTAEDETYKAGSTTFTLTVTAPEGSENAPTPVDVFYESFNTCAGQWEEGSFNGTGNVAFASDNTGWTTASANAGNKCAKFGSSGTKGSAKTPSVSVDNGETYTITFKAAPWNTETTKMSVSVTGGTITGISTDDMTTQKWNDYTGTIIATSTSLTVTFTPNGNNRFFLDEVRITKPAETSTTVTLNKYGYATYCSVNPIDFSEAEGYTAWYVSNIVESTITFTKITGSIKGGQGVLLYNKDADGEQTSNATVKFADSSNELADNLFKGTLAPTYITKVEDDNTNCGLSGNTIKAIKDGTVIPAGKAYLPVPTEQLPTGGSVKNFTFVFDDVTTGITETRQATREEVESIFNLGGQRLQKLQRGINIVNGKKVLVK